MTHCAGSSSAAKCFQTGRGRTASSPASTARRPKPAQPALPVTAPVAEKFPTIWLMTSMAVGGGLTELPSTYMMPTC